MSATVPLVLHVQNLCVAADAARGADRSILSGISLDAGAGEIVAVVGESGSGKSTLARAAIGLLPHGLRAAGGTVRVAGTDLATLDERELRRVRGRDTGMVFQEPLTALNPTLTIGQQLTEVCRTHFGADSRMAADRAVEMLDRVRILDPRAALHRYPHEFSGGMRQRLTIAAALLHRPKLLVVDEPTTALDVIVQREVLDLLVQLVRETNAAMLLVTHDLAVVSAYAHRVAVLENGRRIDWGQVDEVIARPREPRVAKLLSALPGGRRGRVRKVEPGTTPVLSVRELSISYAAKRTVAWRRGGATHALKSVSLRVERGETLAVIGESGSGKTSLARALVRLIAPSGGTIHFGNTDLAKLRNRALRELRRKIQIVFQDPASALDPRMTIAEIVAEGLNGTSDLKSGERNARVKALLEEVGLDGVVAGQLPHQLSGGQRQRVCIARSLAVEPDVLVADEAVSALDLSVQARILALLESLQQQRGFACVFVTHNIAVAERIADRIAVLYRGELVELGSAAAVLDTPAHPYTRALLAASLELAPTGSGEFRIRSRVATSTQSLDVSATASPMANDLLQVGVDHWVRPSTSTTTASQVA